MIFPAWQRLVNAYADAMVRLLRREFGDSAEFQTAALEVAQAMIAEVQKVNAKSWREAAFKAGNGRKIYSALRREIERKGLQPDLDILVNRNATLISTLPQKVSRQVTARAQELYQQGRRPEEIERELRALAPQMTRSHAKLIARTEVGRAETDVTRLRAEALDIPAFQWLTSHDKRVRPSHRKMEKILAFWNDPPNPEVLAGEKNAFNSYFPGSVPNCRCIALALVNLDEVSWPARVHQHGTLVRMTRAQFKRLVPAELAA